MHECRVSDLPWEAGRSDNSATSTWWPPPVAVLTMYPGPDGPGLHEQRLKPALVSDRRGAGKRAASTWYGVPSRSSTFHATVDGPMPTPRPRRQSHCVTPTFARRRERSRTPVANSEPRRPHASGVPSRSTTFSRTRVRCQRRPGSGRDEFPFPTELLTSCERSLTTSRRTCSSMDRHRLGGSGCRTRVWRVHAPDHQTPLVPTIRSSPRSGQAMP